MHKTSPILFCGTIWTSARMISDKKNRRPFGRRLVSRGKGRPIYGARDSTVEICKKIVPRTADMPVPPNTPNMPTAIVTPSTTPDSHRRR